MLIGCKQNADAVIDATQLMLKLRMTLPYRSRGYLLLDSACKRITERYWAEADSDSHCSHRAFTGVPEEAKNDIQRV